MKRYDVVAVGISAVDDLLYVSEYPTPNQKVPVLSRTRQGGGPACTAAAAIGTLGGRAAFVARWGTDNLSEYVASSLKLRQVDISYVVHDPSGAPYHSVIVVDSKGHRNVFYDPSSYRSVIGPEISDSLLLSSELCLIDHLSEPAPLDLVSRARSLGVPILVDVEGRSPSGLHLAKSADYLIVPEEFSAWASGSLDSSEGCAFLSQMGPLATVVTLGARGCVYKTREDTVVRHCPAFDVEAFDTTGCGDTFHGAFALAVARSIEVPAAITFASATAALKASSAHGKKHGWEALPTLSDVFGFLRSRMDDRGKSSLFPQLTALESISQERGAP